LLALIEQLYPQPEKSSFICTPKIIRSNPQNQHLEKYVPNHKINILNASNTVEYNEVYNFTMVVSTIGCQPWCRLAWTISTMVSPEQMAVTRHIDGGRVMAAKI